MSVFLTPLVVEQRIGSVEFSGLPCLALGRNSNLTSNYMADIQRQGISLDDDNEPDPDNIPYDVPHLEYGYNWKLEEIIFPRQSNNLYNTYAYLKNYYREEVMQMAKLEIFLISFLVDNLKEALILETINL